MYGLRKQNTRVGHVLACCMTTVVSSWAYILSEKDAGMGDILSFMTCLVSFGASTLSEEDAGVGDILACMTCVVSFWACMLSEEDAGMGDALACCVACVYSVWKSVCLVSSGGLP